MFRPHCYTASFFAFASAWLGVPAIGVIVAEAPIWNLIWWLVYLGWLAGHVTILVKRDEAVVAVALTWAQVPVVAMIDLHLSNVITWTAGALWIAFWVILFVGSQGKTSVSIKYIDRERVHE